ncbi:hypothetical protein THASP1DRAFT_13370, partial [Thamnocephalis sphaerospora]
MLLFPSPSINVRIELQEKSIVLRGSSTESPSAVLRGTVVVSVKEPVLVRTIHARFRGDMHVGWMKDTGSRSGLSKKRNIIYRPWVFLPPTRRVHTLEPGEYRYPFEEIIPGDAPETVCTKYGAVEYRIKAVVERPGLRLNHVQDCEVCVERHTNDNNSAWLEGSEVTENWEGRVKSTLTTAASAYCCGDTVPIQVNWEAECNQAKVSDMVCSLVEYVQYQPDSETTHKDQRCM